LNSSKKLKLLSKKFEEEKHRLSENVQTKFLDSGSALNQSQGNVFKLPAAATSFIVSALLILHAEFMVSIEIWEEGAV